jgi:hypothetical protein
MISGIGSVGTVAVSASGSVVKLTATGTINDKATFIPPGFSMTFTSTASGTTQNFVSQANPAYSLTAVVPVSCTTYNSTVHWASVKIN